MTEAFFLIYVLWTMYLFYVPKSFWGTVIGWGSWAAVGYALLKFTGNL